MNVVFLDRDGVINKYPGDSDYVTKLKEFQLLPKVITAIKRLNEARFKVFIISNQACVGRGIITRKKLDQITAKLLKITSSKGVKFDGIFYCTHKPDEGCNCRKPGIGNIKKALAGKGKKLSSVKNGFFVGDTHKDIVAGYKAGLKTILVETGRDRLKDFKGEVQKPHYVVAHLDKAVDIILNNENSRHTRNSRRRS